MTQSEIIDLTPNVEKFPLGANAHVVDFKPTSPAIMISALRSDGSYYPIEKVEAHAKGIHHLAVSVFVWSKGALLIQKRAAHKYHCGGQWANTCCTHPHFEEEVSLAAERRLEEELGISLRSDHRLVVDYRADVGNGLIESERVHIFSAQVPQQDLSLHLNPEEVSEVRWISPEKLHDEILSHPEDFTPWFTLYAKRFPDFQF